MTDVECTAVIVALVAAARAKWAKLDGLAVLVLAMVLGEGLSFLTDGGSTVRVELQRGILMGLAAAGGMAAIGYHATKSAVATVESVAAVAASIRPPAPPGTIAPVAYDVVRPRVEQRGFARFDVLVYFAVGGFAGLAAALALNCTVACPLIHAADVACPFVVVVFEDGHSETFRRDDLVAAARAARAVRITDGGAP